MVYRCNCTNIFIASRGIAKPLRPLAVRSRGTVHMIPSVHRHEACQNECNRCRRGHHTNKPKTQNAKCYNIDDYESKIHFAMSLRSMDTWDSQLRLRLCPGSQCVPAQSKPIMHVQHMPTIQWYRFNCCSPVQHLLGSASQSLELEPLAPVSPPPEP